jgi:hypothetical protein
MTYTPIPRGTENWDVPLNDALAQLDASITSGVSTGLQATNNLSDLPNKPLAISNLGISAGYAKGVNQFNVKDYGALGNNVANDATAVAAAVTAANATGGIVYFPPGQYLINSGTDLVLSGAGVNIQGSGTDNTRIIIGASFTGASLFSVTGNSVAIRDISIHGATTTTTSNPAIHGVTATGVQSFKVFNAVFLNVNGYAIRAIGTASQTLHGGMVYSTKIQSCAGGIYIFSDNTNTAANFILSNIFTRFLGVNSGANANLDGIHIEDSWDVLVQNCFAWMQATLGGTGASFRVKGNCAAMFVQNLDALGPQTGNNVVIEDGPNGSPQNVQITGGVIQQGNVGLLISGAATQIRVSTVRIINNQTHGVSVTGTGTAINLDRLFFSLNGQAATGTIYDLNWSGTSTGFVTFCRFASPIVTSGTIGVQFSINVALGQSVRVLDADFEGTANSSANWFTNFPQTASRTNDGARFEIIGDVDFRYTSSTGRLSLQPTATTNRALATNVGNGTNDNFRLLGSGAQEFGLGGANARDTTTGRQGTAQWGSADSDIVITLAGKGFKVASGTNAKAGTVTANGVTAVTVTTTAITANSVVVFGLKTAAGTAATQAPYMSAVTAGTSFQIKSSTGDTSVYNWVILDLI